MGETERSINDATSLLAERRKYEAWIAALDQRRETTPERVFARVRADYEARLDAVVTQLASNADSLQARVAELTQRVEALRAESQAVQDDRAEAELRAHVGELDEGAWESASREADERLRTLDGELKSVEGELASIGELLTAARTPTPARAAQIVEPPAAPAVPTAPAQPEGAASEDAAPAPVAQDAPAEPAPVTGSPAASEGAAGGDAPIGEPAAPASAGGGFDELAFLRDVTGVTPDGPVETAATPGQPDARQPERPVNDTLGLVLPNDAPAIVPTRRPSAETPMAANVASNAPIVLRPEAARQGKTLKCTECSSMNYPTEWYCERCGAELSAL